MSGTGALRITALATHPIQNHAPWFRALAAEPGVDLEVLFEFLPDARTQGAGFDAAFTWDVPLLDGYRHRVLGGAAGSRSRLRALHALRARLAVTRPAVMLLTGWHSAVLLAAPHLARRAGARCLVRGDSSALRPRPRWLRRAHRTLLAGYDAFLAVGRANRDFYLASGIGAARIFACPHLVDNERFAACASAAGRDASRARFGVPHDSVCFLFAGKLEAKKRPLDLLAAAARLADLPVHVLFAGSGALEPRARAAADARAVGFAGFLNQSQMPAAYAAADCLVLPSDHGETWGLVVNEAMACGLPAIVSDRVGCAPDLVTPGATGWVFPCGDVDALAACMRAAVLARARLPALGAAARERVLAGYTPAVAARAVVDAARSVLACGRAA